MNPPEHLPTEAECVIGREGVKAARAALKAASRPSPSIGAHASVSEEEDVWKPRRPKLNF